MTQKTLFSTDAESLDAKFAEFHSENPQVYIKLLTLARELLSQGHKNIGIGMLFEVLRWQHMLITTDPEYKLNNNYRSRYARLLMDNNPELVGMFEIRELHS